MLSLVWNAVRLAFTAIMRNKTRSALTVLGILIGIAAVTAVTAAAGGASSMIGAELDGFAANAIFVWPQPVQASGARSKATGRLTEGDAKAIAREAPSVTDAAPFLGTQGQVVYADKNISTQIIGTTLPYYRIRKWEIDKGENWTDTDETLKTKVCVIGATAAKNLFESNEDPVGRIIRIGRSPYRIIGTLKARGASTFGDDQDDRIMMPIGSFRARVMHTSPGRADQLMMSATSPETTDNAVRQITEILRQRHRIQPGAEPDFQVNTQNDMRQTTDAITGALSWTLGIVAAISLLVGGIGVMNIMLVSVAERTREIGIRMSIGAREGDILTQFLLEAIVLTLIGGALGAAVGFGMTLAVGRAFDLPVHPSVTSVLVALGTSTAIGLVFGFLPARNAAKLDPIEALRTD